MPRPGSLAARAPPLAGRPCHLEHGAPRSASCHWGAELPHLLAHREPPVAGDPVHHAPACVAHISISTGSMLHMCAWAHAAIYIMAHICWPSGVCLAPLWSPLLLLLLLGRALARDIARVLLREVEVLHTALPEKCIRSSIGEAVARQPIGVKEDMHRYSGRLQLQWLLKRPLRRVLNVARADYLGLQSGRTALMGVPPTSDPVGIKRFQTTIHCIIALNLANQVQGIAGCKIRAPHLDL